MSLARSARYGRAGEGFGEGRWLRHDGSSDAGKSVLLNDDFKCIDAINVGFFGVNSQFLEQGSNDMGFFADDFFQGNGDRHGEIFFLSGFHSAKHDKQPSVGWVEAVEPGCLVGVLRKERAKARP